MNLRMYGAMLVIMGASAFGQGSQSSREQKPEILSVCRVLSDLSNFSGKIIAIRGVVDESSEGTSITDKSCAVRLMTNGYAWPNAIAIELPTMLFLRDDVQFQLDSAAIERVNTEVKRRSYNSRTDKLWLTYIGLFETKEKLEVAVYPDGRRIPFGFGHMGSDPGRLLIKTVMEPFIERHKKSK